VNYLKYEIWNVEKQEITYHNTWVTNKSITSDNVVELAKVGRSRWSGGKQVRRLHRKRV
jgi:hypothetical protein